MLFDQDLFSDHLEGLSFWKEASTCEDWDKKPQNMNPEDAKIKKADVNAAL